MDVLDVLVCVCVLGGSEVFSGCSRCSCVCVCVCVLGGSEVFSGCSRCSCVCVCVCVRRF